MDERRLNMDKCQPCRFFRGASLVGAGRAWTIICNWPRNGSEIERVAIPDVIRDSFK